MRKPLLIGLAGVLGLTLWLSSQEQDDDLEVVARPRPAAQGAGVPAPVAASGAASSAAPVVPRAPSTTDARRTADPNGWVRQALLDGVQGWRLRRSESAALPPERPMTAAAPSAWASQQPPPPPSPPKGDRLSEPVAPRFPHSWVGRVNDDAVQRAVLSGPVSTWVVRSGDVIEGQWRIDRIHDRTMTLTYLPLQQSQTVSMK